MARFEAVALDFGGMLVDLSPKYNLARQETARFFKRAAVCLPGKLAAVSSASVNGELPIFLNEYKLNRYFIDERLAVGESITNSDAGNLYEPVLARLQLNRTGNLLVIGYSPDGIQAAREVGATVATIDAECRDGLPEGASHFDGPIPILRNLVELQDRVSS